MKILLKIPPEFSIVKNEVVGQQCYKFRELFPSSNFYYHIKSFEVNRFFIIEIEHDQRDQFSSEEKTKLVDAVKHFAASLNFEIQPKKERMIFFIQNDLNNYN